MKQKMIPKILGLLLVLTGISLLLYPFVSQQQYRREADNVISAYDKRVQALKETAPAANPNAANPNKTDKPDKPDAFAQLYALAERHNKDLFKNRQKDLADPFSYEQTSFRLAQFGMDEEIFGYVSIPKMNIRLPIYLGANKENMSKGAAHLTQTSLPIGGKNSNAVLAAHRGFARAEMFRRIEKLALGDEITISNFWGTLTYRVKDIAVIEPSDIDKILIQEGEDLVTLITCHPYRQNTQRYVVYCSRA